MKKYNEALDKTLEVLLDNQTLIDMGGDYKKINQTIANSNAILKNVHEKIAFIKATEDNKNKLSKLNKLEKEN